MSSMTTDTHLKWASAVTKGGEIFDVVNVLMGYVEALFARQAYSRAEDLEGRKGSSNVFPVFVVIRL